jgi:DNA-binding MarR family transcriptional regulator
LARPASATKPRRTSRLPADLYRAIGQFRRAIREFLAFSEAGARDQGLTSQQHQALLAIKAHEGPDPITVSELAEALLIKTHSCVGLIARLVERGLVERRVSARDRRRVQLRLEPAGEQVLEVISRANLDQLAGVASILDELLQSARKLERQAPARAAPQRHDQTGVEGG